jgi:tRNA-dihydrouridine synthase B
MQNRRFGCQLAFIEMLNVRSVSYKSRKTQEMLCSSKEDRPLGLQILGCEPGFILRALDVLRRHKFDLLDFNAACPVKKVVSRGEGAGLLKEPKKLGQLIKLVVKESSAPVTVKIRIGWDKDSVNAQEVALVCEDAGASGIFVHGRTRTQGYSGTVDYRAIAAAKKKVRIPVIASGDIFSGPLAKQMFTETGCDGLAVARGALGNPWIFRELEAYLEDGTMLARPVMQDIIQTMLGHLLMCTDYYGERVGVVIFRKFFSWYTKGFRHIRPLREKSSRAKTRSEMQEVIEACGAINEKSPFLPGILHR